MSTFIAVENLSPRNFTAALMGLCKHLFYDDESLSLSDLAESLYGETGLDGDGAVAHLGAAEALLKRAGHENLDPSAVEEAAVELGLAPALADSFGRLWRAERSKIHEVLLKRSTWNPHLKNFAWRIDVKTASKDVVGAPCSCTPRRNDPSGLPAHLYCVLNNLIACLISYFTRRN